MPTGLRSDVYVSERDSHAVHERALQLLWRLSYNECGHQATERSKAPGNDNITANVLKDGGEPKVQMFTNMFNRCLSEGKLPNS